MISSRDILTLLLVRGLGRKGVRSIIQALPAEVGSLGQLSELISANQKGGTRTPSPNELPAAAARADRILSLAQAKGIHAIAITEDKYPGRLRDTPDPPVLIYVKGDIDCLHSETAIAIIGTRKPSQEALELAEQYGGRAAGRGIPVVSGLALGCDTAVHAACIKKGGLAIAVLAHGLDTVHPKANADLAHRIVSHGGCLVSEYPPGTSPLRQHFVERDRIQSGLSDGVLLIQSGLKGGSMHTVRFALEQRRPVAAIDPSPNIAVDSFLGNKQLIGDGKAMPIDNTADFEAFLHNIGRGGTLRRQRPRDGDRSDDEPPTQLNMFDR